MEYQILFSGKKEKKYFSMTSAENLTQSAKPQANEESKRDLTHIQILTI